MAAIFKIGGQIEQIIHVHVRRAFVHMYARYEVL